MIVLAGLILALHTSLPQTDIETRVNQLLGKMTLEEKLGQMSQSGLPEHADARMLSDLKKGMYGSLYGSASPRARAEVEAAARRSRLGIPLILGDDVIHGFATGLPIPLGQAASFDPDLVQAGARISARESSSVGLHWTFSPMMDIARDPRWGRIAEGYGEDPYLASAMGVATVEGYQGSSLSNPDSIAACGKHYVGYGAAEAGRDYNSTWIPEGLLRDVYLKPFQATAKAGIASFMSAFNAINGVPASGNAFTLRQVLRNEWGFKGMVVSDFESTHEMIAHGYAADGADAALKAITAGVNMEMISTDYRKYGAELVREGKLDPKYIDDAVRNILRTKFRLGLFDGRPQPIPANPPGPTPETLALSKKLAEESFVLLKNENGVLPLRSDIGKVALIGPLADKPNDQLGSWAHANGKTSITPLSALRSRLGESRVLYAPGVNFAWDENGPWEENITRFLTSKDESGFGDALKAAQQADVVVLVLGELADDSGEASSRSSIDLPGVQNELVAAIAKLGKPVIGVIMAGRPLTFHDSAAKMGAVLYTWHGGPMAGPAIVETLFGDSIPSGKLPVTFPRSVGQIPLYYDHLSTGRPASEDDHYTSKYLDIPVTPEYPFGYGLSYTTFTYSATRVSPIGDGFEISAEVTNTGSRDADEVVQLYTHQRVATVARPVRELKGFKRVHLKAGETATIKFDLKREDLAFWNQQMKFVTEPGEFEAWVAPDSVSGVAGRFTVK